MTRKQIDWNCRLLSHGKGDAASLSEAVEAMTLLSRRCSFSHFRLALPFDASCESVAAFLIRKDRLEERLRALIPQDAGFTARVMADVMLVPSLYTERDLRRLSLNDSGYLPLSLPLGSFPEWADFELNRLLFKEKIDKLLFLSFDRTSLFYSSETVDKLLRIPDVRLQVCYSTGSSYGNSLKSDKEKLRTVLGTEITSLASAYRFCMDHGEKSATDVCSIADPMRS